MEGSIPGRQQGGNRVRRRSDLWYPLSAMKITPPVSDDLLSQMAQVIVREVKPERIILFGSHAQRPVQTRMSTCWSSSGRISANSAVGAARRPCCGAPLPVSPCPRTLWSTVRRRRPHGKTLQAISWPERCGRGEFFMSEGELASRLLALARRDLRAAELLRDQPEVGDGIIGFHASRRPRKPSRLG
jgi:hypothetical protein